MDTNGAGDAFVGGFLAQQVIPPNNQMLTPRLNPLRAQVLGADLSTSVKCGAWAAELCIKVSLSLRSWLDTNFNPPPEEWLYYA